MYLGDSLCTGFECSEDTCNKTDLIVIKCKRSDENDSIE